MKWSDRRFPPICTGEWRALQKSISAHAVERIECISNVSVAQKPVKSPAMETIGGQQAVGDFYSIYKIMAPRRRHDF